MHTSDEDTTIICPYCLKETDISESIKGEGESAEFICPFCHKRGKNPIA